MRKRALALFLTAALLGGVLTVAATGGTAGDPLISKGYIDGTYVPQTVAQADQRAASRYDALYAAAVARLQAGALATQVYHAAFTDVRLKKGDVVQVSAGSGFLLLEGAAEVACPTGLVLDVSAGIEQRSGPLVQGRRYLAGEDTVAAVTVTSPTTVLSLEGFSATIPSGETDYNALADAMKALGLLKGSDTGYGSGYDLERPPTRIQGLIMFLRLLGEEGAALQTTATSPFVDVPSWCQPYVAYAYEKGYTKGTDTAAKLFGTHDPLKAGDYVTFILRALGYRDSGDGADFTWSTVLEQALALGAITAGEHKILVETQFLRAHVVYLSYFALDTGYKASTDTLLARLIAGGTLDATARTLRAGVAVNRLR